MKKQYGKRARYDDTIDDEPDGVGDTQPRDIIGAIPKSKSDGVDHISDLMRELLWETGKTGKQLAKAWGLAPATLRAWSAEASRRVRSEVTNAEDVSRDVCSALRVAMVSCLKAKDWSRMTKAAEAWATISGAKAAERIDMRAMHGDATPEEARKIMAEKFGKMTPPSYPDTAAETNAGGAEEAVAPVEQPAPTNEHTTLQAGVNTPTP